MGKKRIARDPNATKVHTYSFEIPEWKLRRLGLLGDDLRVDTEEMLRDAGVHGIEVRWSVEEPEVPREGGEPGGEKIEVVLTLELSDWGDLGMVVAEVRDFHANTTRRLASGARLEVMASNPLNPPQED
jgi:hypothetical protein